VGSAQTVFQTIFGLPSMFPLAKPQYVNRIRHVTHHISLLWRGAR